jgi:hypothetical protein
MPACPCAPCASLAAIQGGASQHAPCASRDSFPTPQTAPHAARVRQGRFLGRLAQISASYVSMASIILVQRQQRVSSALQRTTQQGRARWRRRAAAATAPRASQASMVSSLALSALLASLLPLQAQGAPTVWRTSSVGKGAAWISSTPSTAPASPTRALCAPPAHQQPISAPPRATSARCRSTLALGSNIAQLAASAWLHSS